MLVDLSFTFFSSFAILFLMRKVAKEIGLVDRPSGRKSHTGNIPLVGGICICISLVHYLYTHPDLIRHSGLYLISVVTLTAVGALDDKYDLSVKFRIVVQAGVSILMIHYAGVQLQSLGNFLGFGTCDLGALSSVVTIFAVVACINAFNMVDGLDGLLGGLSIVTFSSMGLMLLINGERQLSYLCLLLIVCTLPYVAMNLGLIGRERKVFMGDAGSMMIGFTVVWLLLGASQVDNTSAIRPVTALWLIGVPLMDMAAIMIRRLRQGKSPFKPDREHLHHICQKLGFSPLQTLSLICFVSSVMAGFGVLGELYLFPEYIMFYSFVIIFLIYLGMSLNYKQFSFSFGDGQSKSQKNVN